MYFTLPLLFWQILMDFHQTQPIPMDLADSPSDFQWILSDSEKCWIGQTGQSGELLADFQWTSDGRKEEKYDKSAVHWTSNGIRLLIHFKLI